MNCQAVPARILAVFGWLDAGFSKNRGPFAPIFHRLGPRHMAIHPEQVNRPPFTRSARQARPLLVAITQSNSNMMLAPR